MKLSMGLLRWLFIGIFIGIFFFSLLASAQDYNLNSSNLSLNSSMLSRINNIENAEVAISGKNWNIESSAIHFANLSAKINHISTGNASKMQGGPNLSAWEEIADKEASYRPIHRSANFNSIRENLTENLSLNLTIRGLDEETNPIPTDQNNKSKIVVHNGQSIQDAIDAAAVGDIIEINSGTYYENLHIDKGLTIRGVDIGGGQPIIDAGGIGNAVEISADQVALHGIVAMNSSNTSLKHGAGIRFSASNNCTVSGIVSYDNYYGINLADSHNNTISMSNISDSQYGIRIYFSNNNTVEQNTIRKTETPLDIVSSEGNLIQENTLSDNSNEIKTSTENKIINNYDLFLKDINESKDYVELNARPDAKPSETYYERHSSGGGKDDTESVSHAMAIDKGEKYNKLAQEAAGTLVFNPPKSMTSGIGEWIDARIGLENTTGLVQGLLGKGDVQFRDISTATNMTYVVRLEGDSGFDIEAKRPEAQILGADPAVWLWLVTPLAGRQSYFNIECGSSIGKTAL